MLKLFKYLKSNIKDLIFLVLLIFLTVASTLKLPDYTAIIINEGIVKANTDIIFQNGILMLLVALVGACATISVGYFSSRIASSFSMNIREAVFTRIESFSLVEFDKFSTSSLITRSTNDIQQIQTVMRFLLRMVLQAPITAIWAIYKAYSLAPSLSWVIGLAVLVLLCVILFLSIFVLPKFKLLQKLIDNLNLVTRENLTGLRVVRAFNNEKTEQKKFDQVNNDLANTELFVNRLMSFMQPAMMLIMNLTSVLVVWVGAHMIGSGNLVVGDMIAYMQYAMQVIISFLLISMVFVMIPRASISAGRVGEVIETLPSIKDPEKSTPKVKEQKNKIEFKNVSFAYEGANKPALEDISFVVKAGETTAFIGSTGSGKSTLINLIPRFYDVSRGAIFLDGIDLRKYKLNDLYKKMSYVPQKGVLFSGTVKSNIKYGASKASEKEVKKSAEISQSEEFINKFEKKYLANISQGGSNVSGGQKQRLSIARALIRNSDIFIFDDSFSALDLKTDRMLRDSLKQEMKNKTVLIVAQRISTILSAEKIIVLDKGKIVSEGTHSDLIKNCKIYQEIAYSQLSEEDLAKYQITMTKNED